MISFKTAGYINAKFNSTERKSSSELLEFLLAAEARDIDAASKSLSNTVNFTAIIPSDS